MKIHSQVPQEHVKMETDGIMPENKRFRKQNCQSGIVSDSKYLATKMAIAAGSSGMAPDMYRSLAGSTRITKSPFAAANATATQNKRCNSKKTAFDAA